jgi:hypothetical protein
MKFWKVTDEEKDFIPDGATKVVNLIIVSKDHIVTFSWYTGELEKEKYTGAEARELTSAMGRNSNPLKTYEELKNIEEAFDLIFNREIGIHY